MKIVIIHGTGGYPERNRFPRLQGQLEQSWHAVRVPRLPTPEGQTPQTRCDALQIQVPFIFDSNTILIWHSLWATYLLHILDKERKEPVKKALFVSGFVHELGNEYFDTLNKPFLEKDFNRVRIRQNVKESVVFHGDDDPYVPLSEATYLSSHLDCRLEMIYWWWHLNTEAGYQTFPQLLQEIV